MEILIAFVALAIIALLCVVLQNAAYRNGVSDGWGFSRDPGCPGYAAAGEQIRKQDQNGYSSFMRDREKQSAIKYSAFLPDGDVSLQC